jgi:hypothetical protein
VKTGKGKKRRLGETVAPEKEVEELKRQLQPQRAHTHDETGDAHELLVEVDNWDLIVHRSRIQLLWRKSLGTRLSRTNQTFWTEDQFVVTTSSRRLPKLW